MKLPASPRSASRPEQVVASLMKRSTMARAGAASVKTVACAAVALVMATSLHGCDLPHVEGYFLLTANIPTHKLSYWRQQPDYWTSFAYKDPMTKQLAFNSCADKNLNSLEVCNSRGHCEAFDHDNVVNPVVFCKCDDNWGDPECGTRRKSQYMAWMTALLFGWSGADQAYLGFPTWALMKFLVFVLGLALLSVGFVRLGMVSTLWWWAWDVVRIGSTPVRAQPFQLAPDLPRWTFVTFTLLVFAFIGFLLGVNSIYWHVIKRRRTVDRETQLYGSI